MEITVKNEHTCRTCLKSAKEDGVCLFEVCSGESGDGTNTLKGVKYCEMLSYAGIYAKEGDGLPNKVCRMCSVLLPQAWSFLNMCKTSDTLLRHTDALVEVKIEEVVEGVLKIEEVAEEEDEINHGDFMDQEDEIEPEDVSDQEVDKVEQEVREGEEEEETTIPKKRGRKKKKRNKSTGEWKCRECGTETETECRLKKHYKREHSDIDYTYPCLHQECGKVFKRRTDLRVHMRVHNGERPYCCDWCGASFSQWGTLRVHKYAHTGEKPYSCSAPKCNARFSSTASLRRHQRTHTGDRRHVCELCGSKFICASSLRAHQMTHSVQRPHRCELCDRSFKSRLALRCHQMTHGERTFVCEDCGKEFFVKGNLSKHRKKMHKEGAGTCPICRRATSDLKEHATIHSQELNYKCEVCQRSFRHKGILNAHMVLHTSANKYKCPAEGCSKAFYRKNLLEFHHNKVHANNTPHECPHCSVGFYRISDMTRHVNTFHSNRSRESHETAVK